MYNNRYLSDKHKHYRKRRIRNRLIAGGAILLVAAGFAAGIYFSIKALTAGSKAVLNKSATSASASAFASASTEFATPSLSASATATLQETKTPAPLETTTATPGPTPTPKPSYPVGLIINKPGMTISGRFIPPKGFERADAAIGSYASWLRAMKLKPDGTIAKMWNGAAKNNNAYAAVLDMNIGTNNLQQGVETAIRLNAEYKFNAGKSEAIVYHFVSGFSFSWDKWRQGGRVTVKGSMVNWTNTTKADSSAKTLQEFLQTQFNYTNIHSITAYDLVSVKPEDAQPGDLFVNYNGAVAVIADIAINASSGEKCLLLVSGFTPAQQPQVLNNLGNAAISPWFQAPKAPSGELKTSEFTYDWKQLMRFKR